MIMKTLRAFTLFFMSLVAVCIQAQDVFVIPVETEIDLNAYHHFRQALKDADTRKSDLILVKLNTYGGALDAADSIRTAILRCEKPTVAFVDVNAASAGALIALACDSVFMAPGASMGSATVVNGQGEPMPQKYQSYMSTIMRATAEHHGKIQIGDSLGWRRSPEIAASMVNPEVSVSFTSRQAVENGFADGIANNIPEVLDELHMPEANVEYYRSTLTDDILGFLSGAGVRAILVMLIFGGIYMEMHTPGLGFAAVVAAVAAVLYFLPMFVAGSMPAWVIILFLAGVVLIFLELFVVPGFGITGISGMLCCAAALIGSMMSTDSVTGFDFTSFTRSLCVVFSGAILAVGLIIYLTSSRGPKCFRRHAELMTELSVKDGFVGVDMSPAHYIGHHAETLTDMRPSGKIEIGDKVFDAVSTGNYIPAGRRVRILSYENAQLYVKEDSKEK